MIFYIYYYSLIATIFLMINALRFQKLTIWIPIIIIILISGTRFETGYDFLNYTYFYTHLAYESLEPLFSLSIVFFNLFTSDPQILFFAYSVVTLVVLQMAISKYTIYHKTSLFIYLLIPGLYLNTFSIIRQGIAEVLFFLAISYLIYDKNKIKFVLFSIFAVLFHYTSIIPILLVAVTHKLLQKKYATHSYLAVLLASIILYKIGLASVLLTLATGHYASYIDEVYEGSIVKLFVLNLFMFIIIIFKNRIISSNIDTYLLNLTFIGIFTTNIFLDYTPVTRLGYYFLIFQIIIVPKMIYSFKENFVKLVFFSGFFLYYFGIFYNSLYVDELVDTYPKMTPYQNYFFKD